MNGMDMEEVDGMALAPKEENLGTSFDILDVTTDEVGAVSLSFITRGKSFHSTGWSKKHPKDEPDRVIAALLAYARAFEDLSWQLRKAAQARMTHNELHQVIEDARMALRTMTETMTGTMGGEA